MGTLPPIKAAGFTVVILQPGYLPWLGFFDQMCKSDVFVMYDDVQFDKHGWRNRNRIKTPQGAQWLTVPVLTKGYGKQLNKDVLVNNADRWSSKHLGALKQNYSKAPFFRSYIGFFEQIYARRWKYLMDLNMTVIRGLMRELGLERKIVFSSDLGIAGGRTDRLVGICTKLGAQTFLEGDAGQAYLDESLFRLNHIEVEFQGYKHPVYRQLYGDFASHLSVVDLLLNHGSESLKIIIDDNRASKDGAAT
jgi:hypothetical protein